MTVITALNALLKTPDLVIERTDQLNRFMRSFSDVFRLPAPVKAPVSVVSMLENNVRLLSARPEVSGVTWKWEVDDRGLVVAMDRGQMEQAFLNVLQNAVDAAGGRGTVLIQNDQYVGTKGHGKFVKRGLSQYLH